MADETDARMQEGKTIVVRPLHRMPFGIDQGAYLQSEAALLVSLPRTTVRRWLQFERGESTPCTTAALPLVSFLDLISLRAVTALRQAGLHLSQIRKGTLYMRDTLKIEHPLASEDLLTDGVHRFFGQGAGILSEDRSGQWAAQELVRTYLQDVHYRAMARQQHRLATSWEPQGVRIDPLVQRGAPCVAGSRVQIAMLKRYTDAGDSPEHLAELFELDVANLRTALQWYEGLTQRAA